MKGLGLSHSMTAKIRPNCLTMPNRFSLLLGLALAAISSAQRPENIEKRVDALLSKMTLEEKLGQMSQTGFPRFDEDLKKQVRSGRWGSFYNGGSPEQKLELQRIAIKESRLGIPLIYGQDVIHGHRTIWPIPLGQAATWDPELVRQASRITAAEASSVGIHWTFSPMVDIARDPRWGRIAEGYGEDPYLGSALTVATIRGYQGENLWQTDSIAACAKHYVGYGAAEGGRDYNSTWIPENLLREVYLAPFHAAKKAGVASYMSAFNAINGVPASGNPFTLRQVLRKEWGFDGFVVSDYESVKELIAHGYAADEADAALKAITGGVNMEMVSTTYWEHGKELVKSGKLKMAVLDQAVREILRVKFRLGLFDGRALASHTPILRSTKEALAVAKRLAAESLILLKNKDGALPLKPTGGKVAVIGPLADAAADQLGTWATNDTTGVVTPLAALRSEFGDRVIYVPGMKDDRDRSQDGFPAAVEAAKQADVVLVFLGEDSGLSGEASARAHLDLPGAQAELVEALAKTGKPLIGVVMAGRPDTLGPTAEKLKAILYSFHPGTMGGSAIADVLMGKVSPSGKTPVSFPQTVGQIPIPYNHLSTGRPHDDDDHYTTGYADETASPAYPFGFGLSYTTFSYSNIRINSSTTAPSGKVLVTADVRNTGAVEADEVVQLYAHRVAASVARPVRELKGFRRVHLKPGQTVSVTFELTGDALRFYDQSMKLVCEPGTIEVWVAPDSISGVKGSFRIL